MTMETTLGELGLGPAEERVYRALSRGRSAGAERLRDELGMTREEFGHALERLGEYGFTVPAAGGLLPRPVPAGPAVRALVHRRTAELHRRAAELERIRLSADAIAGRLAAGTSGLPPGGLEAVHGADEVARRVEELIAGARRDVVILDRPPYATAEPGPAVRALLERGVRVRLVLGQEGLDRPGRLRELRELAELGLGVRIATRVPTKLVMADWGAASGTALLPPDEYADPTASALVVGEGLLRPALGGLFEAVWDGAVPFGDGAVPPQSAELLGLLASGLKDEAIARRLGVHVHTVRRRIGGLLGELGAGTRFQAGLRAAMRGWLGPDA
ncbi:hypothetical protein ABT160_35970 [Streptomyces sp. NPDC001941]|uniref:hypothetical protein n=1 Tax=Streptomyces sp. NPDC001941 TaxID=3154659 RepID=UPI0033322AAB